jgi:DMSO/TMAO reductase YedYZ molybdopterin-dependent catalytic subunit
LVVLALLALTGCAGPSGSATASSPPSPAPATQPPGSSEPAAVPVGQVRITGAVRQPGTWTIAQLSALPTRTVTVGFGTDRGPEQHTETGVPLDSVLDRVGLLPVAGKKHSELSAGVLAIGADGYQALVSFGELAPNFGNRGILLATTQDGRPLERPRLVVPGDVKGGRDVNDVVELHVVNTAPTS